MASPAPALLALRSQIDRRWPRRNRASDGIMGDAAHRRRKSAHNVGDAIDITHDPVAGPDLRRMVEELARQMRANPHGGRLRLMIFDRRIYSPPSWTGRRYYGVNPHRSHAHFEVKASHRQQVRPWSLP